MPLLYDMMNNNEGLIVVLIALNHIWIATYPKILLLPGNIRQSWQLHLPNTSKHASLVTPSSIHAP